MTNPQNVELEAAKFLHKLIQESRDEPTKLATKLYVILQHMRSSGKENSMPYQVISRAMETVIKDNNLDIESLMSSRLPLASGSQIGDSASQQLAGSSQQVGSDKESKPSFSGNEMGTPDTYVSTRVHTGPASGGPEVYQGSAANATGSYKSAESANKMQFGSSSFDGHGFAAKTSKDRSMEVFTSIPSGDHSSGKSIAGRTSDGSSSMVTNANKGSSQNSLSDTNVLIRTNASMDIGKFPISQASSPGRPFNDQQLKQLRAQCLVFLAFRNGLMPKQLHLEIALGNTYTKEDGSRRDLVDQKRKDQLVNDPSSVPQIPRSLEKADSSTSHPSILNSYPSKEVDFAKLSEVKSIRPAIPAEIELDRRSIVARGKTNAEVLTHEAKELHVSAKLEPHDSSTREIINHNHENDLGISHQPKDMAAAVMDLSEQSKLEESSGSGNGFPNDIHKMPLQTKFVMNDMLLQKKDDGKNHTQNPVDSNSLGKLYSDKKLSSIPLNDPWKPVVGISGQNYPAIPIKDSNMMRNVSQVSGADQEGDYAAISTERQPSPKHTTIERWILEQQKRKALTEQNWAHKQQKTEQRISSRAEKLKEIVSASEDISAKTKSVIELKKLQLLELQRHLRSDILSDFFKPIASEMDRLKSIKKHRIGRRSKQIERYEQRMKEERQKRIREKHKDFFSDLEVHRERLEDGFKIKRERWKGLNRYVREFHKKKERLHREKIDRIQREKINLLKINDVEGYLRMVQDAKSDRVKQLLKETEKYLQKLGSKLKDAKAISRQFENDMEESKVVAEENDDSVENEDEAKHYLESNEKYYTMAHSVKENILEQPTDLIGGKLREYQMNGLRWLVSLYNNHLNGILADEMGLGKTVQVISLICYLMENKNDRGPFLVVVPSSVLPGWESEIKFWAPSIHRIVYSGPPEERRKLFKEHIVHQKFNVLLTTYEYLMNKHDRPKLSKIQWHYVIIDEGHRIKNASCKLNADLKHYRSNHRLLLTGTPLQNNLEELWALLNFLLPNIFNSSDDFSQWFNKPFESNGDNSPDEALLSEEENLLIINRLHQVLRPFVLRRLKHKVENQLPEKIERLIRCEASSYQKLLMKRVEDNLGAIGTSKARSVHNSVMEMRNICNHPYLSQLHVEEVHDLIPKHYLPHVVRLCGKLEMLDRLLPKLKATDHRVLFFSTMTRLLDVMEDYLCWKQYKYLRLDGHTSGGDRGGLIERFNQPDSPYFIFLLSIRAGGVGVNLQAADTVIIFDTDWNPQVDLQAQARAHRIGQKKDVLVLRLETVQTVEEQVRASAEHKLGVANQSITAGFFDNNTSAEDRREYLESLLRENKKEEEAPVLDDDSLNDLIARREEEIDIFESVDKQRREEEMAAWQNMCDEKGSDKTMEIPPLPSRLLTEDDLKSFYEMIKTSDKPTPVVLPNAGVKRKSGYLGGLDTQQYGRGKRAREVRSYEEQMTEEEFERLCAVESPESPIMKKEVTGKTTAVVTSNSDVVEGGTQEPGLPTQLAQHSTVDPMELQKKEATTISAAADVVVTTSTPPSRRGRGRPKRGAVEHSPPVLSSPPPGFEKPEVVPKAETTTVGSSLDSLPSTTSVKSITSSTQELDIPVTTNSAIIPASVTPTSKTGRSRGRSRKAQTGAEPPASRRRGQIQAVTLQPVPLTVSQSVTDKPLTGEFASSSSVAKSAGAISVSNVLKEVPNELNSALPASVVPSASPMIPLVPPVSVVSSASDHSAVDVSPQLGVVTDPTMASDQDLIAPVAVESVNKPDLGIAPVLSPQASAPLISGASQSVISPSPAISQGRRRGQGRGRGRGRGLDAQSQEETPPPQRRRRKQEPVVSMISGAAGHDSASSEPPQKRTRASVGRKDTVIGETGQELKNACQHSAQDAAHHVSKGKVTAEEKFADSPQDQTKNAKGTKDHANVVLALSFNSSDAVQSALTSVPATKALTVISESVNQLATGTGEPNDKNVPDNRDSCDSLISVPVMFGIDDIPGSSEDPHSSLIINRDSIELVKDQGVNKSPVVAATSGSIPLVSENEDVDCQNEDGKINVSKQSINTDVSLASDSLLKQATNNVSSNSIPELCDSKDTLVAPEESQPLPILSRIPVETAKEQVLNSAIAQDASALGFGLLPGESSKSDSHFVKEEDKFTESFESPRLDESLVLNGNTSEIIRNTNNGSVELQKNEHEKKTTMAETEVSNSELHVDSSATVACTVSLAEPNLVSPDALVLSASGNVEVESQGDMDGSSMTPTVALAGHDSVIAPTLKADTPDMAVLYVEQVPEDIGSHSNKLDNSPQGQQDASEEQVSKAACLSPEDSRPPEDQSDGALNTVYEALEDKHTKESAVALAAEVSVLSNEAASHTLLDLAAAYEDLPVAPIETSDKLPTEELAEEENAAPLEEVSISTTQQVLHLNSSSDEAVNTTSSDITNEYPDDKPAAVSILTTQQVLHPNSSSDMAVNMMSYDDSNEHPEEKPVAMEVSISTTEHVLHPNRLSDVATKIASSDIANEHLEEEKPAVVEVFIHPNSSTDVAVNTSRSDVASEHPNEMVEVGISATGQVVDPISSSDVAVNTESSDVITEQLEEKPAAVVVSISTTEQVLHTNSLSDLAVNAECSDIVNEQLEEKPAAVDASISTTEQILHPKILSDVAVNIESSDVISEQLEEKHAAAEVEVSISTTEQVLHPNSLSDVAVNTESSNVVNEQLEKHAGVEVSIPTTEQVLHPISLSDVAVNTESSDIINEQLEEKHAGVEVSILTTEQVLHPNSLSDVAVNMESSDIINEQLEEKHAGVEVSILTTEQVLHPNSSSDVAVNTESSDVINEQLEEKHAGVEVSIPTTEQVLHPISLSDVAVNTESSDVISEQLEEKHAGVEISIPSTEQVLHPISLSDVAVNTASSDIITDVQPEDKPTGAEVSISTIEQVSHPNSPSDIAVNRKSSDAASECPEEKPATVEVCISTTGLCLGEDKDMDSTPEESTPSVVPSETAENRD